MGNLFAQDFGADLEIIGIVVAAIVVIGLLVAFALFRRRRRKPEPVQPTLTEDLSTYPPPPALWGDRRLTIYGLPVRLRLVVVAPLGYEAGEIQTEEIEALLDRVVPGLGTMARSDKPRIRIWPTQLSHQGFTAAFRRETPVPGVESEATRWILIMGRVLFDKRPIGIGLALLGDQDNFLGKITMEHPHQWMEAMRVRP